MMSLLLGGLGLLGVSVFLVLLKRWIDNWGYIVKLDAPKGYKYTEEEIWARREELSKM